MCWGGSRGRIEVKRADRFGNAVVSGIGQPAVVAAWTGPGTVTSAVTELRGGCVEVAFSARTAGTYTVALRYRDQDALISGALLSVRVNPGPAAAAACAATLISNPSPNPPTGAAAQCSLQVGGAVALAVDLRDACGNATADLGGQTLVVEASGPAALAFKASEDGAAEGGAAERGGWASFSARPAVAGEYVVAVRLGGVVLPSWPQVPAPALICPRKTTRLWHYLMAYPGASRIVSFRAARY